MSEPTAETAVDIMSALRQADRDMRNAVNAFWDSALAEINRLRARIVELELETASASDVERRTPDAWCSRYGVEIRRPNGWGTPGAPSWHTPITLADFRARFAVSTARPLGHHTLGEIYDLMSADLKG